MYLLGGILKCGHLDNKIIYKKGTKEILNRYLEINGKGIVKNLNSPIEKILKDNSTSINIKSNNSLKEKKSNSRKKRGQSLK